MQRIAVLMTCYNRIKLTESCLKSIYNNIPGDSEVDVFLVDDACTDGTEEMVKEKYPQVKVLHGDGNLFWNGGMHFAFSEAVKKDYDFYTWVNDDVVFYDGFFERMINTYRNVSINKAENIIVGVMVSQNENEQTYGGIRIIPSVIPLKMGQVKMETTPKKCDTFHGNCVLIHKSVVKKIGIIDSFYQHAFGDADYGLTATRSGVDVWMTNYYVGKCDRHDKANKWLDKTLSFKERKAAFHAKTANPPRDWKYFCKKFCGWNWWIRYWAPDVKLFFLSILKK